MVRRRRGFCCFVVVVVVVVVIVHWHCSAQLSMFNMEMRYRNKIIIMFGTELVFLAACSWAWRLTRVKGQVVTFSFWC